MVTLAVVASAATVAPGASAAERAAPQRMEGRRRCAASASAAGGRIALTVNQSSSDSVEADVTASDLPTGHLWNIFTGIRDASDGDGGSNSGLLNLSAPAGTVSASIVADGVVTDPVVKTKVTSDDSPITCLAESGRTSSGATSCAQASRQLTVTASKRGAKLEVESRYQPVKAISTWIYRSTIKSSDGSEGTGASIHGSADGVAHVRETSFDYAANRTITVA